MDIEGDLRENSSAQLELIFYVTQAFAPMR